jgi:hypothetical protein
VSEQPVWVTVSAHVQDATPITVRLHPEDDRVVVLVGDSTGWPKLDLYLTHRKLAVFRDTLTSALVELDDAVRALADTDTNTSDTSDMTGGGAEDVGGSATARNAAA